MVKATAIGIISCKSDCCTFTSSRINVKNCNAEATNRDKMICYCKANAAACLMFSRSTVRSLGQTRTATCYYSHWR